MAFQNTPNHIDRQPVVGALFDESNEFVKMFDPPTASPVLPERMTPTNPVPEVMAAVGVGRLPAPANTVHRQLLARLPKPTWDGVKNIQFFVFTDPDLLGGFSAPQYPAATIRVPRGVIFHGQTTGNPPPHTIHWHGIEPTPLNDGVGHCSMEIGSYLYQWQPNFIGTYFYHCHRNTVQHFEFGLFGLLIIEPPDTYFASVVGANFQNQTLPATITLNNIPVGACSDGLRRTAANTTAFPQFPGFISGDPIFGVTGPGGVGVGDPRAFTVPYDVEAIWVLDDRDSIWSDLAPNEFTTFPTHGAIPGDNDQFNNRPGANGFFAFNDFNADYWFVTGVPVPAHKGETETIDPAGAPPRGGGLPGGLIPAALNSGVSGSQIAINATVGQTILVRCLDAAYNKTRITFPVDVVIIAWDGRALGVPPFGRYNHAFLLPANTPITTSTARRFDGLIRATTPVNSFAKVEFLETRGDDITVTARIPIVIS
ncbi:MAG: hypothetical protein A2V86_04735 [Deltaproteobacteria bacterium RBG_16_49_23]|nr:MAG: hypothetical protein A2V86_04735 [Deltaproteobacteria bacterium RBG_16_49_23]